MEAGQFNIVSLFTESAKHFPDRIAIIEKETQITYSELAKEIDITAAYFQQKGISKGDRVLVFVPMGIDLYRIVLALFKIGATAVFLDEWVSFKRLNLCCKIADCTAFIGILKARILTFFSSEIRKIPVKLGINYKEVKNSYQYITTDLDDIALITFTTGSSGTPKAAKRTHGFLRAQFEVLEKKIDPEISKIDMPVLPIVLMINLGKGLTSVIADFKASKPESLKADKIIAQIEKHQVESIASSPYFVLNLAKYALENDHPIKNIKRIFTGGAAVFPEEAQSYVDGFPNSTSKILYGSTEAEPISSVNAKELAHRNLTKDKGLFVGPIDASATVLIMPIEDRALEFNSLNDLQNFSLDDGEIGEIIVSGPHVLKEYVNNPDAMKRQKIWVEGRCWHRTGDSGFRIGNELFLTGPCNALIQNEAGFLSPFLYEEILKSNNGVKAGTIIRIRNKNYAVVEIETKADSNAITKELLRIYAIDDVHFMEKIPRDPRHFSKIEYKKLKLILKQKLK
ncbi:peptide synthase [Marivirga tractuosa]|uniref:AMP-dependent synthetase and ligase n=1 Tax=Marivirga tractuosa (strain ATCC 23168 / DSM 4126 / NBRC 15989 / NCIMB 1408 / VKM B-1430 / H-43) TaxID=643867 RepID=E4TQ75_MARTH|nr:AMP-binding protein [Marivirga tractuosa]ADR21621.1 AMP-dependent synthetase and ligase [Marivirga tractuosa DSM 4126]BDD13923.1 peptide synthase [Marivirga tractuosa]